MRRTLTIAGILVAVLAVAPPGASAARPHPAGQQLATLSHDTGAFAGPSASSRRVTELSDVRPITAEATVLPVIAHTGRRGARWLEVLLPGRPDGHTGWIRAAAATRSVTYWRITVRLSTRVVTVYDRGAVVRRFLAVVGKPSTPTPVGRFFVEESVAMSASESGAPYALALSARSNVLASFDGGPGQIALHGVGNIGGVAGTDVSHGCVRLQTPAITWLARHISPGVRVTIVA